MTQVPLREQLGYLKNATERLGVIHEAQIVQLRNYPLLIPNVKTAETKVDIEKKTVVYECESKSKQFRKTKQVKIAIENIVKWIHTIIWTNTIVEIKVNGKSVYDTRIDGQSTGSS